VQATASRSSELLPSRARDRGRHHTWAGGSSTTGAAAPNIATSPTLSGWFRPLGGQVHDASHLWPLIAMDRSAR